MIQVEQLMNMTHSSVDELKSRNALNGASSILLQEKYQGHFTAARIFIRFV